MKVLVTGGSGMLGAPLSKRLAKKHDVTAVSRSGNQQSRKVDLTKKEEVDSLFKEIPFDLVLHTAAFSDVDGCERNAELAYTSNALSTKFLSQHCGRLGSPLIYVSTDYVFDGEKKTAYEATDATCPVNIYGLTKLVGEYQAMRWAPYSAIVRTSWLFGEGNPATFVNAIIRRLQNEKIVKVLDDQVDCPTSVDDLSEALERIGDHWVKLSKEKKEKSIHGIFQVCNKGVTTRLAMTLKMKEWMGLDAVRVERAEKKDVANRLAVRPTRTEMSTRAYEELFKVKLRSWEESLKEYLKTQRLCAS